MKSFFLKDATKSIRPTTVCHLTRNNTSLSSSLVCTKPKICFWILASATYEQSPLKFRWCVKNSEYVSSKVRVQFHIHNTLPQAQAQASSH